MRLHIDRAPWPDVVAEVKADMKGDAADRMRLAEQRAVANLTGQIAQKLRNGARFADAIVDSNTLPVSGGSFNARAWIWAKGAKAQAMITGFAEGSVVRSPDGFWLAIPLPAVPRTGGNRARRMTPGEVERRLGVRLRLKLAGRTALLVMDHVTPALSGAGYRQATPGRMAQGRASHSVPMFLLIPQAHLPRRLDLDAAAEAGLSAFD